MLAGCRIAREAQALWKHGDTLTRAQPEGSGYSQPLRRGLGLLGPAVAPVCGPLVTGTEAPTGTKRQMWGLWTVLHRT
jgi:hypothetical protein